jgi:hypothetical protein
MRPDARRSPGPIQARRAGSNVQGWGRMKNEYGATGSDGRFYLVVRIPSSTTRGPLDGEHSQSGTYTYYLADGTRLNPIDHQTFETVSGHLRVTVDFGSGAGN